MKCNIDWLNDIKKKIAQFLYRLSKNNYSYFNYSYSGDIASRKEKWGLGNLVFAAKILYITGLLEEIDNAKKQNLSRSILQFVDKSGYIYDPFITKLDFKKKVKKFLGKLDISTVVQVENIKRAETRQSFAALHLLEQKPKKPFLHIPHTKDEIENYLLSFDWQYPWAAGSHFSHLLFFLHMNSRLFEYKSEESKELIKYAVNWITKIQSSEDACWYIGSNVPPVQKINGAMKILTGLHAADIYDFPYAEKLIDTALSGINDAEACSNFNIVYVLYGCSKINPDYRKDEVQHFLVKRIQFYKEYYHPDKGGFSFFKNRANDIYYGKKITEGKNEPDIHGTLMFVWGLAIINKIMNIGLNFRVPVN